jgi:hypothetical protein
MDLGIMRKEDYAAVLGVDHRSALSNSARRGLARAAAFEYAVQDYRAGLGRRKMFDVSEAVVLGIGLTGGMYRAGEAEIAMHPGVAPYVQNLVMAGNQGLLGVIYDIADS